MGQRNIKDANLNETEIDAVKLANKLKLFIKEMKNNIESWNFLDYYPSLEKAALATLDHINEEALATSQTEISNYYYLYFLQQLSKFNQLINQTVQIQDERAPEFSQNNARTSWKVSASGWDRQENLNRAGIKAIVHPLLNQTKSLLLKVKVSQEESIFREPVYDINAKGKLHFHYDPRKTPLQDMHQEHSHYLKANYEIGSATQISNSYGLFQATNQGQNTNHYFKSADKLLHEKEQKLFRAAIINIQSAKTLSKEELEVLQSGKYYRYNSPYKFTPVSKDKKEKVSTDVQITHIGHAAELISFQNEVPLTLCIDPVHYQTGTGGPGGIMGVGGKIFYDRYTDPAFNTEGYPAVNLVLISHNHFDHMCEDSIREAFGNTNTLFIIPAGDAKHLESFGIKNYIEMGSWNDKLSLTLEDALGNQSQYEIRAFPAKHASCRGMTDMFESLYMGYLIRDLSTKEVILCTGDTAVLDQEHFDQFEKYLLSNQLSLKAACIAHGPDRPRKWMECSHQSTADAISMHARFNMMNAKVFAKNKNKSYEDLNFDDLKKSACFAIGYHQGCYRLGLLSLNDVDGTLLRTFSVLKSLADTSIDRIDEALLKKNPFYCFMDKFEQKSLLDTLKIYNELNYPLTANQLFTLITSHLNVPQPGYRSDFAKPIPYEHFIFDYQRLIVNKNPSMKNYGKDFQGAFEEFCYQLNPSDYLGLKNKKALISTIFTIYLKRPGYNPFKDHQIDVIRKFQQDILNDCILEEDFNEELGRLYEQLFPKQDEGIRDEGHRHTMLAIIAGLLNFGEFREFMHKRYNELHHIIRFDDETILEDELIGVGFGNI